MKKITLVNIDYDKKNLAILQTICLPIVKDNESEYKVIAKK